MASLTERSGVLGHRLAAHLLRRATYHPTKNLIDTYASKTALQAINDLMNIQAHVNQLPRDPNTGLEWIDINTGLRYDTPPNIPTSSNTNLRKYVLCWWLDEARLDQSIGHKMEFFLHSIWVTTANEGFPEDYWDYLRLLRFYSLGSYKELAKKMTVTNQMLRYLNNKDNNNNNPNENYAREFLELFTIGKGPQIGPGDYTNYTEDDVVASAKVLTGFKLGDRAVDLDPDTGIPISNPNFGKHETSDKTFSSAFQTAPYVITGATSEADMFRELDDYVEMVFAQDATAITICRRLYQYFVSRNITAEVETDIIVPLANTLRSNNYELEHVIRQLLASQHFYDSDDSNATDEVIGSMIKSPLELTMTALNYFQVNIPDPVSNTYDHYFRFYRRCFLDCFCAQSGMGIFTPTNVAGYPAYYQEPVYHRNWFNSSSIISRYKLPDQLLQGKRLILSGDLGTVQYDIVPFVAYSGIFSDPSDAFTLVTEMTSYLFCETPSPSRLQYFVDELTSGFDTNYWAQLWADYSGSSDTSEIKTPLENLFKSILYSPEFQLM